MRPAPFEYVRPSTVAEALEALADGGTPLAGGQSLLPQLKLRQVRVKRLVDLNRLADLAGIEEDGGELRIGAMTRHQQVAECSASVLAEAARRTADMQVRARGTIGGNVCHADSRANLSTALIAAGATAIVASSAGERRVAVEDLFAGMHRCALEPGELLTAFEVPDGDGVYEELTLQPNGLPILNVAVCGDRIAIGGLLTTPKRLDTADAIDQLLAGGEPLTDIFGDARYRARVAPVLLARALRRHTEGATA